MGVVVRNVTRQNVFSYHWVNEGIVKEAARLEQKKKLEKLRMDRTRMMNRRLNGRSNKISLPDIINSQIIAKMNKAGK